MSSPPIRRAPLVGLCIGLLGLLAPLGATGQPAITAVSPVSSPTGTTIRIYGENLGGSTRTPTVSFDATTATVEQSTASVLKVEVPAGTDPGPSVIRVSHAGGSARAPQLFSILASGRGRGFTAADTLLEDENARYDAPLFAPHMRRVNNDARPDLVMPTATEIYWRAGSATGLGERRSLLVPDGETMRQARFADFDGNDTLDVATVEDTESGHAIRIYLREGNTFEAPRQVATGDVQFLRVADADGDGALDLVGIRSGSEFFTSEVSIYENALSETNAFGKRRPIDTLDARTNAFLVADLNRDEHRDLVVQADETKWLPGTESGFGDPKSIYSAEYETELVQVADLQGDGRSDLLYRSENKIKGVLQDASGAFETVRSVSATPLQGTVHAGDVEGDGDLEFLWGDRPDYGSDNLVWQWAPIEAGASPSPRSIARTTSDKGRTTLADWDGDGDLDLLATVRQSGEDRVLAHDNADLPPQAPLDLRTQSLNQTIRLRWTASGDWDLSHYRVYRSTSPAPSTLLDTVSASSQAFADTTAQNGTTYYYRVAAVDEAGTEGDPSKTVRATPAVPVTHVAPTSGTPGTTVRIFGGDVPTDPSANTVTFGGTTASVVAATGSRLTVEVPSGPVGPVPVVVHTRGGRDTTARRFTIQVQAQRGEFRRDSVLSGARGTRAAKWLRDVDQDGDMDLLGLRPDASEIVWYEQTTDELLTSPEVIGTASGSLRGGTVGDVDGDGDVDLIAWVDGGDSDPADLTWFENENGTFSTSHTLATNTSVSYSVDVALADFDGDGAMDVLTEGADGELAWYRQTSFGRFTPDSIDAEVSTEWVAASDVDGDGDLDVLSRERRPALVRVYDNQIDEGNGFVYQETVEPEESIIGQELITAGDLDDDGLPDLFQGEVRYPNEGGTFGEAKALPGINYEQLLAVPAQIADIDADGRNDVLLPLRRNVDYAPYRLGWFTEKSAGEWTRRIEFAKMDSFVGWTHGDVDGDGDLDLLARREDGTVVPYLNGNYAPEVPTNVRAAGRTAAVTVDWKAPRADDLSRYRIYRQTEGKSETQVAEIAASATQWTDFDVVNGTAYRYRVTAVDSAGQESAFSTARTATPAVPVTAVRPSTGRSGTPVRVYGAGFDSSPTAATVTVGGASASVTDASTSVLDVTIPDSVTGPTSIRVQTKGTSRSVPGGFTVVGPASHGDFQQQASRSISAGDNPAAIRFADVDGDGDRDLITARASDEYPYSDQYEYVWLENTDSTRFDTAHPIALERGDDGIPRVADIDLDGDPDLLSLRGGTASIWYANDGTGQFGGPTPLSDTVQIHRRSRVMDLDADGDFDLVGNGPSGAFGWYEHTGVRSFAPFQPIGPRSETPNSVAAGDVDTDGDLDLVVGYDADAVYLEQTDDGSWTSSTLSTDSDSPKHLRIADLNGDDRPDLLMRLDDRIAWMKNEGNGFGSFRVLAEVSYNPYSLTVGDVSGDGLPDIVYAREGTDAAYVDWLWNKGAGQFSSPIPVDTSSDRQILALEDLNEDGALDLVQGKFARHSPSIAWWKNTNLRPAPAPRLQGTADSTAATLSWTPSPSWDVVGYELYRGPAPDSLAQIDSVGTGVTQVRDSTLTPDTAYHYRLIAIDSEGAASTGVTTIVQVGKPSPSVSRVSPQHGTPGTSVHVFGAALDDAPPTVSFGDTEASVVERSSAKLTVKVPTDASKGPVPLQVSTGDRTVGPSEPFTVLRPSLADTFTTARPLADLPSGYISGLTPIHVDDSLSTIAAQDSAGFVDLLSIQGGDTREAPLVWYRNQLRATNAYEGPFEIATETDRTRRPTTGDLDGDRHTDVLLSQYGDVENTVYWYDNQGAGSFVRRAIDTTSQTAWAPSIADVDADGDADVIVGYGFSEEGRVVWYENYDGNGHFASAQPLHDRLDGSPSLATLDADDDGDTDLVGSLKNGSLALLLNDGTGQMTEIEETYASDRYARLKAGDVTGDGFPDLLRTTNPKSSGGRVWLARNQEASASTHFPRWTKLYELEDSGYFDEYFSDLAIRDLDGDGDLDLVLVISSQAADVTERVVWAENRDDEPGFRSLQNIETGPALGPLVVTDADANGALDIIVAKGSYDSRQLVGLFNEEYTLPVELATFRGGVDGESVRLRWATASETNNAGFRVQRRTERRPDAWTTIGTVDGAGTTSNTTSYRFVDSDLPFAADSLRYRLKQVDTDGSVHYSETITVQHTVEEVQLLGTYPNPASQQTTVRYALPDHAEFRPEDVTMRLYDILGRRVRTVAREATSGRHTQTLDVTELSSGVYFLRLRANGKIRTQKLTVVR